MGCSNSKSSVLQRQDSMPNPIDSNHLAKSSLELSPTTTDTSTIIHVANSGSQNSPTSTKAINGISAASAKKSHHVDHSHALPRGYSSGASSDEDCGPGGVKESSGWDHTNGLLDQPRVRLTSHDITTDMRHEFVADGDLAKAVIRIETPFGKPIEDIYDGVHTGPVLGSGVSGIVRLCTHRATSVQYAVKCLDLGLLNPNGDGNEEALRRLRDEIYIMCQLDHPNIVRLEEVYESTNELYLVQELCLGGDLFDRLDEQLDYHYTEAECARLVKQMLSSIRYLHSKNIIHRDLKLENFLFSSTGPDSELKMIDFGLSKHFFFGQVHHEAVGTPYTVAPEILKGSYNEKCDIWALGVITYLLLSGETPFGGDSASDNMMHVRKKILSGLFQFRPADIWENVSEAAKEFVKLCLHADPDKRPTAKALQKNPWIQMCSRRGVETNGNNKLNPNVVKALVGFKEYSDMRKLLCEVLSFTLLPEQIVELREEFEKIDKDGRGEISLSALKQVLLENAEAGSLGALTEQEIQEIFNALRVRQSQPMIKWHEFIAAGLSQCKVDDRNLRLAFDRLDANGKGFISIEDIAVLMGSSKNQDSVRRIWLDGMTEEVASERITYDDFLRIMKGQSKDIDTSNRGPYKRLRSSISEGSPMLGPVPEGEVSPNPLYDVVDAERLKSMGSGDSLVIPSLLEKGDKPSLLSHIGRRRSQSFEHPQGRYWYSDDEEDHVKALGADNSSHIGHLPTFSDIYAVLSDESKTPLLTNRALYRKHREMRLAVLEASKQFDLLQHARRSEPDPHGPQRAGLVMRRGTLETAREFQLEEAHRNEVLNDASRRAGRGRKHARKKTISDMSGLMTAGAGEGTVS